MRLLASLPTWALVIIWLAVCGAFAAGTRLLLHRYLPPDEYRGASSIAGPLMPALGAAFALLAALSLAGEATSLRQAEDQVSGEAAAASRLAWGATSPGLDPAPVDAALLNYLQLTRNKEWNSDLERGNDQVLAALAQLERAVRASAATQGLGSAQASDMLGSMGGVSAGRRQRLAAAHHDLPDFYLAVVAVSGLALIANSSALALDHRRRAAFLPAGLVVVVGLVLALLLAISGPFRGDFLVSRYPIDQVIADLKGGVFR